MKSWVYAFFRFYINGNQVILHHHLVQHPEDCAISRSAGTCLGARRVQAGSSRAMEAEVSFLE